MATGSKWVTPIEPSVLIWMMRISTNPVIGFRTHPNHLNSLVCKTLISVALTMRIVVILTVLVIAMIVWSLLLPTKLKLEIPSPLVI